jgi:hypothetical protein
MTRMFLVAAMLGLAMPAWIEAHQLDEYLQAARVGFARDRVVLEIDLTPGANIASEIVRSLDRDGDGVVVPLEARAYGETVVGDLALALDDRPVRLTLSTIEVPSVPEMHQGVGTMHVTVTGELDRVRSGTRHVRFSNHHHPASSVYVANALLSTDPGVRVVAQRRDRQQRQIDVEYVVASGWPLQLIWLLFGATLIVSRLWSWRAVPERVLSYNRATRPA